MSVFRCWDIGRDETVANAVEIEAIWDADCAAEKYVQQRFNAETPKRNVIGVLAPDGSVRVVSVIVYFDPSFTVYTNSAYGSLADFDARKERQ